MKKIIIISISATAIFLVAVFSLFCLKIFPKGNYKTSDNIVDNSYNNCCLSEGNVVEINNKLYFNYNGNDSIFLYGLYEIDSKKSDRIYTEGPSFSPGNNLYKLQKFEDKLLFSNYALDTSYEVSQNEIMPQFDENIYNFDLNKHKINELYSIKINGKACRGYYYVINNKFYIFTNNKIYLSSDGVHIEEVFSGLENVVNKTAYEKSCYISDNSLLYISNDNYLVKYDLLKKKQIRADSLSEISNDPNDYGKIFSCNEKVIITIYNGDYVSIYAVDDEIDLIYKKGSNDYYYINSSDNKIFISSKSIGLDMIDLNTSNIQKLVKKNVCDTYIFDNKWVYYVDFNGNLNRITQTGANSESIFK